MADALLEAFNSVAPSPSQIYARDVVRGGHQVRLRYEPEHVLQNKFVETKAQFRIIRAGRRFGKTVSAARMAVEAFIRKERVLYGAPTAEQLDRFWSEVSWSLEAPIYAGVLKANQTEHTIEVPRTDQRIKAKTMWDANTARGDWFDLLILDEWQLMAEETWEVVCRPMILDRNGRAVFIYTPPSLHSAGRTKALDPRHAAKMYKAAVEDMKSRQAKGLPLRWFALSATSYDNPTLSRVALDEIAADMTSLAYRQEILAEDFEEAPGALWTRKAIDQSRLTIVQKPEQFVRVVVAVDPPGSKVEAGIVTAGIAPCRCRGAEELHAFVLEDVSERNSPEGWAMTACAAYHRHEADRLVAEVNFGADMVASTIRTADPEVLVLAVHASRGKAIRAEPVAALAEQGRIHHVGQFPELEDELCSWTPQSGRSPNRLDALVWAITSLMFGIRQTKRRRAW